MFPQRLFLALIGILLSVLPMNARVLRVDITSRKTVLNGKAFGNSGPYERIVGRIYFSLPVANPHNQSIVDLRNAQNLRDGEVEVSADFTAVRPKDPAKGNHSMLLEVPNRGNARFLALVDGGDEDLSADPGDAWLLRQGFTVVSVGWQWDAANPDALRLYTPIATQNGKTITGLLRGDIMPSHPMAEIRLGHLIQGSMGGTEYPVAAMDDPRNVLTIRNTRDDPRTLIPRSDWQFAHTVDGKLIPADRFIHLNGGFQTGKIYEYVYVVANPVIAGAGFAAIRDVASWAKHDPSTFVPVERVYGQGISQNGRFLRDFLYQGFNADEQGRIALDGVLAHVAGAGRGSFNYRFAQPSRDAQPTSSISFPTDVFPFTDKPETDPLTHETAGLLDRATQDKVVPKIFFSNTSYEYWGRAAALIHITADGKHDASIAGNIRIYHFTGLQHFPGPFPPAPGTGELFGQQPESALPIRFFWRAMVANMDAWVRGGELPPPSNYPRIADGNLVTLDHYELPAIPGLDRPHDASEARRLDFGSQWRQGILSLQPPKVGPAYPVLVPQVDVDGNERDGVRLPEITVPLGTYVGWNLRNPAIGAPTERLAFEASYRAFAKTKEDRQGDPRKSIAERYKGRDDYLAKYAQATDALIQQRWVLSEDRATLLHRGSQEWAIATQ
jgi:Alpha/beta hydrolase domain